MANVINYIFNISGNFASNIGIMVNHTEQLSQSLEKAQGFMYKLGQSAMGFAAVADVVQNVGDAFSSLSEAGIALDSQMHDLSAVAGVTGGELKEIEGYARESAKAFGTDAATAVEGYKLLLSQLTPELGKCPEALKSMGESIQITSKLMGNDGVAAAEVLTTAMNQYGVSLEDPMEASRKMAEMMNVMAAAGQEGSAELPQIKAALQQCGMAANAANVAFEETNAAIQVLDKTGKKGSEGGVALRNVLGTLSQGRFIPKDTREALQGAGVDINKLADTTQPLKNRLEVLKPLLNDAALFSKLFGTENANAARALVQGTEELGRLTEAVSGTKSAEEQAAIVMDSYAEKQARINQKIADFKISVFQLFGDFGIWVTTLTSIAVPISQLLPLIITIWGWMSKIKLLNWAGMWGRIRGALAIMVGTMSTGKNISLGFAGNIGRATIALLQFGTIGIFNALKGLGALIISLITGGATSAKFAGIASTAFGTFATTAKVACRAVSTAIMSIPIIGWVIAGVTALAALGIYFWNTSVKFRAVLKGLWAGFKAFFTGLWELAKGVFGALGDLIKAAFTLNPDGIKAALNKFKNVYSDFGHKIGKAFSDAYNAEMEAGKKEDEKIEGEGQGVDALPGVTSPTGQTLTNLGTDAGGKSGGSIRNITISIDRLVEKFEVHSTTMREGATEVKEMIEQALLQALNDANLAVR
ncbi:MAG: phage tail tape measure protein [Muribaculaceae bacterium]|nr:phage tail tape measure protein [Muribaculaceae bacterium]